MQIARVLSAQTPAQINKHAEFFFKENLKANFAGVKQYCESISSDKKHKFRSKILLHIKTNNSLSNWRTKFKYYAIMLMHTGNYLSPFLLRKRPKF
jgi:hypothetical protein